MPPKDQITVLGTSPCGGWFYVSDVLGEIWGTTRSTLGPSVLPGLARGRWEVLAARYPLRTATDDPLAYNSTAWRSWLLAEARRAGPISARKLPAVRFVTCGVFDGLVELPPMAAFPAGRVAYVDRSMIDLSPPDA